MNTVAKPPESAFLVKRPSTGSGRPEPVEGRISLFARDSRDLWDGSEVSSSLVAHVLLVSLILHAQEQGIGRRSRHS